MNDPVNGAVDGAVNDVRVLTDAAAVAEGAASFIYDFVKAEPSATVLVATGNTPVPTYAALARMRPDMSRTTAVQLDEYLVPEGDPRTLYGWLERVYTTPLGVKKVVRFDLSEPDPGRMCQQQVEAILGLGGIDLAVLGLGPNGHLGFNEPPSSADAPTRVVELAPSSLASNAGYWSGLQVPRRAVTVGMDLILSARVSLLLVTGEHKRAVLRRMLHGPTTPDLPASYLTTVNLTVMTDQDVTHDVQG